jgi:hypothetical protein
MTLMSTKCRLLDIIRMHPNLMIPTAQINLRKEFSFTKFIK